MSFIYKDLITEATLTKYEIELFSDPHRSALIINWLGVFYHIHSNDIPTVIKELNIEDYTYDILDTDYEIFTGIGFGTQEELFKGLKRAHFLKSYQDLKDSELVLNSIKVELRNRVLNIKYGSDILLCAIEQYRDPTHFTIHFIDDLVRDRLDKYNNQDLIIHHYNIIIFAVWLDNTLSHNTKSASKLST